MWQGMRMVNVKAFGLLTLVLIGPIRISDGANESEAATINDLPQPKDCPKGQEPMYKAKTQQWICLDEHYEELEAHHPHHDEHEDESEHHEDTEVVEIHQVNLRVWLVASGAIFLISLCGIFGVLVIPIMQRIFYQHLIQFLVALAIGTLAGDALLHLLPHALMQGMDLTHRQHEEFHQASVWRGFAALMALFVFFIFEKLINHVGEWREAKRSRDKKVRVVRTGHRASEAAVGEKVCKHKYSAYCVQDIESPQAAGGDEADHEHKAIESSHAGDTASEAHNGTNGAKASELSATNPEMECFIGTDPSLQMSNSNFDTVFVREHEHKHHGHSHAHSHLTSKPDSISSVAWMVIFGDGIHNIADGLAIGAAFSESYLSGFSTTIAVLCHELPHEIGDFALLLKAGMTVKQAIFYNVLSSVLAFIGMVSGLLLGGNLDSWTAWIFCATAGIFLYVALVDMMPELSSGHAHPISNHAQQSRLAEIVLQLLGMGVGVAIMLVIALYEHDLKELFQAHHHAD